MKQLSTTFLESTFLVRKHPILLSIIIMSAFLGMFSEGFDRLWTPYLLQFSFPVIWHLKPIVWFGIISLVGMGLTIISTEVAKRYADTSNHHSIAHFLLFINSALIVSVIAFGLAQSFVWAILAYWCIYFMRELIIHYIMPG